MASPVVSYLNFAASSLALVVVVWQSILSGHFTSTCCGGKCCSMNNSPATKSDKKIELSEVIVTP